MVDNLFETCTTMEECNNIMNKLIKMYTKQMKKVKVDDRQKNRYKKKYSPTGHNCGAKTAKGTPCKRKAYVELQGRCPCHSGVADRELNVRDHPCHVDFMSKFPNVEVEDSDGYTMRMNLIVTDRYTEDYGKWNEGMPPENIKWLKMVPRSDDSFEWDPKSFSLVKVVTEGCVKNLTKKAQVFKVKFTKFRLEIDEDDGESMIPLNGEI